MKYLAYLAILMLIKHGSSDPVPQENSTTTTTSAPAHHATQCELSESSKHEKKLLERLNKLKNMNFTWEDDHHRYFFSICSQAKNAAFPDEGFIQIEKTNKSRQWVIGRLNDVDLEGFEDLIRLNYKNGDEYANSCNKSQRNAVIYIKCDQNMVNPSFTMIEENNDRSEGCAYIFLLKTREMCSFSNESTTTITQSTSTLTTTKAGDATNTTKATDTTLTSSASSNSTSASQSEKKSKLGILSIIFIALGALLAIYFVFGIFYMRFVNQATGWEQIPNFGFWNAIGERSADLCNLICRCGNRRTEIHTYENINDHISDDENLLNM